MATQRPGAYAEIKKVESLAPCGDVLYTSRKSKDTISYLIAVAILISYLRFVHLLM
jgi:hypothetical protein